MTLTGVTSFWIHFGEIYFKDAWNPQDSQFTHEVHRAGGKKRSGKQRAMKAEEEASTPERKEEKSEDDASR
jgi:hypothetical protein